MSKAAQLAGLVFTSVGLSEPTLSAFTVRTRC
jgi:hypothetical protein